MNATHKFIMVAAVIAMAFAGFAVLQDAEISDAEAQIYHTVTITDIILEYDVYQPVHLYSPEFSEYAIDTTTYYMNSENNAWYGYMSAGDGLTSQYMSGFGYYPDIRATLLSTNLGAFSVSFYVLSTDGIDKFTFRLSGTVVSSISPCTVYVSTHGNGSSYAQISNVPVGSKIHTDENIVYANGIGVYAIPDAGYGFSLWSENDGTTINGNMNVYSYFTGSKKVTINAPSAPLNATVTASTAVGPSISATYGRSAAMMVQTGSNVTYYADDFIFNSDHTLYYDFDYWLNVNTGTHTVGTYLSVEVTADIEYTAVYKVFESTIDFDPNGGTITGGSSSKVVQYGQPYGTFPDVAYQFHTLTGWFSTNRMTYVTPGSIMTNIFTPETLEAQWEIATYTIQATSPFVPVDAVITLSWTGGTSTASGGNTAQLQITGGEYVTMTASNVTGYTFLYWVDTDLVTYSGSSLQFMPTANKSYTAVYEADSYTVTFNSQGGTPAAFTKTVEYNDYYGELPTPEKTGYTFTGWFTSQTSGDRVSSTTKYTTAGNTTLYAQWAEIIEGTFWSNDLYNGTVSIAFKFSSSASKTHVMAMPLYTATFDEQRRATWDVAGILDMTVSYPSTISVTLNNGETVTKSFGNWSGYVLNISPSAGSITFVPMDTFNDFTSYTLLEGQADTVYSWDTTGAGTTIHEIIHKDTGPGTLVKFSVVNTWTYLDTFGVVLNDPHINVNDYFPQYEKARVNLYAFGVYGEAMTINGKSWDVVGSNVTITYTTDDAGINHWAAEGTAGAETKSLTLSNISITWDGTNCWLSSNTDGFIVDLGSYSNASKTFSFTGLWYFTATLDEPYTATQTVISGEWESLLDIDATAVIILFLGIVIAAGLFCHVKFRMKWLDGVIIIVAIITAFVLLG